MKTNCSWDYKEKIVKPKKKKRTGSTKEVGLSSDGLFFDGMKAYFDKWFGKILADNQVREDRIMSRLDVVAKKVE